MERRRNTHAGQSAIETLRQLPALVVLERLPVAVLATTEDGLIVFANTACAEMLGYEADELLTLPFRDIFHAYPTDGSAIAAVHANADLIVELVHREGAIVRARMSKSALMRGDDPVALAAFHDLSELLWLEEH